MRVLLLAGLWMAGAQAAGYRIAGTVVNAVSGQPVSGVRVMIAPVEHPGERFPFVTGPDGRFVFAGMPAARYDVAAERRGFLTGRLPGALVVGPDQHTDLLKLPISPPGVIAGRVTDDAGDPVGDAHVQLFSSAIEKGRRRLSTLSARQTADNGEYRFGGLAAGTYYVAVSAYPWYAKLNQTHGETTAQSLTHTGYGIQYYPGTADPAAAEPIALKTGQELAADFMLVPLPAVSLHVHTEGGGDSTKQYTLTAAGPGNNPVLVRQGSQDGDLYTFWAVPPGRYTLEVRGSLFGRQQIDVGALDVETKVKLAEAPSLAGTVKVEGEGHMPAGAFVVLFDTTTGASQSAPIGGGGRFSVQGIPPEHYQVALSAAGEYYLKRWSAEGGLAVRLDLDVAKGAAISGKVQRDGKPESGKEVVLADSEDQRAVETDSDGGYEFRGVAPGSYALFAVEDGVDLEYANPAAIQAFLESAKRIKVSAGGSYTVPLELPAVTANPPFSASPAP